MVHFITASRVVVPSSFLASFTYRPAPSTLRRLALIFKESSPETSNRSLTSLLFFTTEYLKENLLTLIGLVGMSAAKMSLPAVEFSASNVRPIHKVGEV